MVKTGFSFDSGNVTDNLHGKFLVFLDVVCAEGIESGVNQLKADDSGAGDNEVFVFSAEDSLVNFGNVD